MSRWLWLAVGLLVLSGSAALRAVCFRNFHVPTGAMANTIVPGDFLFADMVAYGVRFPFTDHVLFGERLPARGDIIVFRFPEDRTRMFIKRVIGLPGETLAVRGRGVYIGGRLLPESYTLFDMPFGEPESAAASPRPRLEDAEPGDAPVTSYGPVKVPERSLFVMGDNRYNTRDSRYWGFLPLDDVRGKAWRIYFSRDPSTNEIRWGRIGQALR